MTLFSSFALAAGALLTLLALVAAWLFRTASAPLWAKVLVPSLTVAVACAAPLTVASLMGFPVNVSMADLPERAALVAFVPHDASHRVDLWLIVPPADAPRAYDAALDARMKQTLRAAEQAMAHGQRAVLEKRKAGAGVAGLRPGASDRLGIGDDQTMYVLDAAALSALPPKE